MRQAGTDWVFAVISAREESEPSLLKCRYPRGKVWWLRHCTTGGCHWL